MPSPVRLRYAAYVVLLWVGIAAYPFSASAGQGCGTLKDALRKAFQNEYAFLSTAISSRNLSLVFFVKRSGEWQIIGVDGDDNACVVAQGTEWRFAMEKAL